MAFTNFTNSPSNGATLTANGVTYTYVSSKTRWEAAGGNSLTTEQVQDITGAMFTGNTETGIAATYEDSDGTIDLVVSAASSAATLTTPRNINGVSFDGSADITLPGSGTDWDTTLKTASFTGVSGKGYLVNTTGGVITVTLPASPSAGNTIEISDVLGTSGTNKIIIARNGSKIYAATADIQLDSTRANISLIYTDATNGWVTTDIFALSPSYTLTASAANVNEGVPLIITLVANNVATGVTVPYTITGVTSADLGGVSLTGNFTVSAAGTAVATFTPAEDTSTEGAETMVLTINGTSTAISTTINDTSLATPSAGTTHGFVLGGQTPSSPTSNSVERISFASVANSSDHGDLHTSAKGTSACSNKAGSLMYVCTASTAVSKKSSSSSTTTATSGQVTLNPGSGEERVGLNSADKGYIVGGENHNKMDRFPFASEGSAADVGNLLEPNNNGAQASTQSLTKGYICGAKPSGGTYGNTIQRFPFAAEGNTTDVGDMTAAKSGMGGGIGPTHGFIHGRWPSANNVLEAFPFASEGNSSDIGDLNTPFGIGASFSSQTHAYHGGGYSNDNIYKYTTEGASGNTMSDYGGNWSAAYFNTAGGFV